MNRRMLILTEGLALWMLFASAAFAEDKLEGWIKVSSGIRPTDLVVYIANPSATGKSQIPPAAVLDQRNQTYIPHVLAILKGATVKFQNSDRVTHNVFSLSPAKPFDVGKIPPEEYRQVTFDKPGIVEVLCGFHSRMLAYVRVMEHPYFAVPDVEGKFVINDVPPGTYQLRIWHESLGETAKEMEITVNQNAPIRINFPR